MEIVFTYFYVVLFMIVIIKLSNELINLVLYLSEKEKEWRKLKYIV